MTPDIELKPSLFWEHCWNQLASLLWSPSSNFSIWSLSVTAAAAAGFIALSRTRRNKRTKLRVLVRALFPRKWLIGPSARADLGMAGLNVFITAALIGWAIVSASFVEQFAAVQLGRVAGAGPLCSVPGWALQLGLAAAFYLSFEAAYFVDHYLKHRMGVLWHFHKVHHTAETLSPLTNYRVHPLDSLFFYNIVGVFTGVAAGLVRHLLGSGEPPSGPGPMNYVLFLASLLLTHLQHSQVWIAFTGRLGRFVLSPAHHQIHHSSEAKHFDRNFGNTLAVFDRLAGTLYVPTARRERVTFGAGPTPYDPHGVTGLLVAPFADAAKDVWTWARGRRWRPRFRRDIASRFA